MKDLLLILLLSISWLLIYFLLKYIRLLMGYVIVEFPIYLRYYLWKKKSGISKLISTIYNSQEVKQENLEAKLNLLNKELSRLEVIRTKLFNPFKRNIFVQLLFSPSFYNLLMNPIEEDISEEINFDYDLLNSLSSDQKSRLSGAMNIKYSSNLTEDKKQSALALISTINKNDKELIRILEFQEEEFNLP